jgi:2',3'-cyclic-nucleotide 2'-phosphodiesterase
MRILFIGDVVGRPGRYALRARLGGLREELHADFVIANGENVAGGSGITRSTFSTLREAGVDVVTGGNHTFKQREALTLVASEPSLLRPDNFPPGTGVPGQGTGVFETSDGHRVAVLNLLGRVNLGSFEDPFSWGLREAAALRHETPVVIVDFHAEVTSEKVALGWHLDGHVSAVIGTHTHVQTADERVLPEGTAFITDVGMTGPHDSVLGVKREIVIQRFIDQMPCRFEVAKEGVRINAVLVEVDEASGRALSIDRISEPVEL